MKTLASHNADLSNGPPAGDISAYDLEREITSFVEFASKLHGLSDIQCLRYIHKPFQQIFHTQLYSPFEKAAQLYAKNESENLTLLLYPSDCLHDHGTVPDLSRSSVYFFSFTFFVHDVW